jgi:predicted esterase
LGIRNQRDAVLYAPKNVHGELPLVLYLHGAGGSAEQGPRRLGPLAETLGFLLLSPASAESTWDAIRGGYGVDVKTIDQAMRKTLDSYKVDRKRIVAAGFSDGASYALGLALRDRRQLCQSVVAFSPGFIPGREIKGPGARIFISHGTDDQVLPIDQCSRQLVPRLKRDGYAVTYREFQGPHTVPPEIAEEGLRWALTS